MTTAVPWESALRSLLRRLDYQGFTARKTFDLQRARRALGEHDDPPCPSHGLRRCSCQFLVLQVSGPGQSPYTVVLHGNESSTKLTLLSTLQEAGGRGIAEAMQEALRQPPAAGRRSVAAPKKGRGHAA